MPERNLVFLSYAREDIDAARRLYHVLSDSGIEVWFDQECLAPGMPWKPAIRSAIRESRYFVALLSSRSTSKRGFVQTELREAIDVLDQLPESETYLIPVRLDPCDPPQDRLNDFQWVDLFPDWAMGERKLLRFLGGKKGDPTPQAKVSNDLRNWSTTFAPTVRVDGFYQSKMIGDSGDEEDYRGYLRFYPDGLALSESIVGELRAISAWFNRQWAEKNSYASKGIYSISGANIKFSTESSSGVVNYEGDIQGDSLLIRSHSLINGHRGVYEYTFISFSEMAGNFDPSRGS